MLILYINSEIYIKLNRIFYNFSKGREKYFIISE